MRIDIATRDDEITACFDVMAELRSHLKREGFLAVVRELQRGGYNLAYVEADGRVVSVAGYRLKSTLFCDRFLYVDDLVTTASRRSEGFGRALLSWLIAEARRLGCATLHLDSRVERKQAHHFYHANGLMTSGYHFQVELDARVPWSGTGTDAPGPAPVRDDAISGPMRIRSFRPEDEEAVVALWEQCDITRPWNDPHKDIARKVQVQGDLFLVGTTGDRIVAALMAGYEGHRGWVTYLAVAPAERRRGFGRQMMAEAETRLRALGCPKINLQVRRSNLEVASFYRAIGYVEDDVASFGRRLEQD